MVNRQQFHELCLQLKTHVDNNTIKYPYHGICYNLNKLKDENNYSDKIYLVSKYSKSWKHYSGYDLYPVPGGVQAYSRIETIRLNTEETMWTGEYGELRKQLLDHLIYKSREPAILKFFKKIFKR